MDYGKDTVDSWASTDDDDDFCYVCDDWAEDDGHGNCKECGVGFKTVDPFISPSTAKVYSLDAPTVSAHGDVWDRGHGSGYTWGGGGSWYGGGLTSMWGGGWSSTSSDREARMLKHKRHLDSLCKVVDPNVKHTLQFSTDKSYSNMGNGSIFVDGSLLKDNDDKLDVVAGLSIHEKLHLVHTKPLIKWERYYRDKNQLSSAEGRLLHNIGNIIEDEWIESQLAQTHGGYVSYIQKVKEHYFEKHGEKIEKCKDPFGDVLNTLLALVRYPQAIDNERKRKHAKHIQFFVRALKDGLKSRDNTLVCIESLYDYMRQLAKEQAEANEDGDEEGMLERATEKLDEILGSYEDTGVGTGDLSDKDIARMLKRLIQDEKDSAERHSRYGDQIIMEAGVKASAGELSDYEKAMGTISHELDRAIRSLEDSDYTEEQWDKGKALGLKIGTKVTWRNQKAKTDRAKTDYSDALTEMKGAISGLRRRIDLYGDTKIHTIRNQRRGRLDKKMLHKIPLGREDLFKNVIIDEDKPLDVCLLVDESGSMGYAKMNRARQTAIAIREALKDNQALNLWVFGHTADGYQWDAKGQTNMSVYWSPTYKAELNAMGDMQARSENRDGMAILASADRVKGESPSASTNKLMIVISDGEPSADRYRAGEAIRHVKKCVRHLEGQGWSIIQIGISGASEWTMKEMFSNYVFVEDTSQLANQVSKIIRKVIKV